MVHAASIQDRDGAVAVIALTRNIFPSLRKLYADGGYAGDKLKTALRHVQDFSVEIVRREQGAKGFVPIAKRWVVERTFA